MNSKQRRMEKRHGSGVRHNPRKVGRPPKIGVEKGFGPRHGANAKEGEEVDLTKIPTDNVPAMLTEREAVLNRNAAELAGRDEIEELNQQGNELAKQGVDLAAEGESDVAMRSKMLRREGEDPMLGVYGRMLELLAKREEEVPEYKLQPGDLPGEDEVPEYRIREGDLPVREPGSEDLAEELRNEQEAYERRVKERGYAGVQRGTSNMKSKQKQSKPQSGSPYVQGFEAQKAKGYEGGVAKLPKPAESVGGLGTPQGYTNVNKWGNPYGWNPGVQPQVDSGQPHRVDPNNFDPGYNRYGGGQTDPGYVAKMPPMAPGGTQNVNQYGVAYGWNPGGGGVEKPYPMPVGGSPWPAQPPGGWTAQPQPLKSGGLYPPGQGIFRGASGSTDVTPPIGAGNPEAVYGPPIQLSAPDISKLIQQEGQKQGLNSSQIAALTKAFSSFGGGDTGYANQSLSAGEDFGNPNYIGLGTPSYQGGISEVGYPPGIAPRAVFSYEEGGWTGPLDPRWSSPGYQGGTSGVPGLYRGENDFRPSTSAGGGVGFHGGRDWNPNNFPPDLPPANMHDPADFFQDPQVMNIQQFRGQPGFPWSPTMLQTTYNPQGYPRAVPAGPDWNRSGPPPHTPKKYKS